jgi:hypothetical protein
MNQITGTDEMMLLGGATGECARLAEFAMRIGALASGEDPELPVWEERLLELRRRLLGSRISAELICPSCAAKVALIFGDDDLPRAPPTVVAEVDGEKLRALRLSDVLEVEARNGVERRLELLLAQAAGRDVDWAKQVLVGPSRAAAVAALEQAVAGLDLQIGTTCTECGGNIVAPFDVPKFVLTELEAETRRLLDGVHRIASTYHWSEAEILALPRERRQAYLTRIERDDLRSEIFHGGD